jgi:phospholipid transport system substrate-binding protein
MLRYRFFLPALILAVTLALTGAQAAPDDPAALIQDLVHQALQTLTDKQATEQIRQDKFRALLQADFDMPRISRFVLGRYWSAASEADRQAFDKLFEQWVVRTYSTQFNEYSGEQVKVTGSRAESDTGSVVSSQIIRTNGAPPAKVDWRVRKEDGSYKIVDVSVEGVSMALTERDQISSVIDRNGGSVSGLNKTLEEKLASGDVPAAPVPAPR